MLPPPPVQKQSLLTHTHTHTQHKIFRPAFEGSQFTIGCKGFRAIGHHEAIALRKHLETQLQPPSPPTHEPNKRAKSCEQEDVYLSIKNEPKFWSEEFEDDTILDDLDFILDDDFDFKCEIRKVIGGL